MKKKYLRTVFRKILVPVIYGHPCDTAIRLALSAAEEGEVRLLGIVSVPKDEPMSAAAVKAREVRSQLRNYARQLHIQAEERVCVSFEPWKELVDYANRIEPDLLVLEWPLHFTELQMSPDALDRPPCDVAIISGEFKDNLENILAPVRGGPYAELAMSLSLAIARNREAELTSLHVTPENPSQHSDAPFRGFNRVLKQMPEIKRREIATDDPISAIRETAKDFDLVVMGAAAPRAGKDNPIGPFAEMVLENHEVGVIVVKTHRPIPASFESELVSQAAISILVDKWFAENTYHAEEFEILEGLLAIKQKRNLTISLALPALNEEETVGNVIRTIQSALFEKIPLLDEIVLIDSNSTDHTRDIARDLGVPVYIHQEILPQYGARRGKGEALWKSLYVTKGDIVLWIDTDIVNISPHFVYGLIGPLLLREEIKFVKGFYQRPLKVGEHLQAGSGGRVTELAARPLLNLLYPELSGLFQPLAGEYGGRREALEKLPFSSGYGVEIGMLIDLLENFGLSAIAQVDLQERVHHNQSLEALSKMSFTIIQTVFRKLERRVNTHLLDDANRTMKLIRYEPGRFYLDVEDIAEEVRPAMIEIPEYMEKFSK